MFWKKKVDSLDVEIQSVLDEMSRTTVYHESYPELLNTLGRLYDLKNKEEKDHVSRDTIALIVGNIAGILVIVAYEQKHVMSSKALSQVIRPRPN